MGYIILDTEVPSTKKLVLSDWFRVPQKSIDACRAAYEANPDSTSPFNGVIPITCLGRPGTISDLVLNYSRVPYRRIYTPTYNDTPDFVSRVISVVSTGLFTFDVTVEQKFFPNFDGFTWVETDANNPDYDLLYNIAAGTTGLGPARIREPTYIGVNCKGTDPYLDIIVDVGKEATVSKASYDLRSVTPQITYQGNSITVGTLILVEHREIGVTVSTDVESDERYLAVAPTSFNLPHRQYADRSAAVYNGTERFALGTSAMKITASHWHNYVLSLELKNVSTKGTSSDLPGPGVSSASRAWLALDDVNYVKEKLSDNWPEGYSDDNAVLTEDGYRIATHGFWPGGTNFDGSESEPASIPSYSLVDPAIPSGKPGLPAQAQFVDNIYEVERGELQMFLDVTADTALEEVRRVFILAKDDKGVQKPAPMSDAEKYFKKKPEVKLHGSGNWKKGRNTGSLADPPPDGPKPGEATGDIRTYKPNPNLGGDQGDD